MKNEIEFEAGTREQIKAGSKAARFLQLLENELPVEVEIRVRVEKLSPFSDTITVWVAVSPTENSCPSSILRWSGTAHFCISPGRKTPFRNYRASERVRCHRCFTLGAGYLNCS